MKQTSSAAVEFSWKQFWVSLVYENLPPVIFSPFAALLVERSFARAWNVCQNRNLLIAPSHNNPLYFVLFSWLITYPASWLITCGLLMVMAFDTAPGGAIDELQMLFAYSLLFTRRLIIAVKYGFSEPMTTASPT